MSKGDLTRSYCISFDASMQEELCKTYPRSLSILNPTKSYKQKCMMSLFDLKGPFHGSHMQSCTEVINTNLIEHGSERFEQI